MTPEAGTFDPDTFMQQTVDAPMETERELCPKGEFTAVIGDFDSKAFEQIDFTYKKGDRAGTPGTMTKFTIPFSITDDNVKAQMQRPSVTVTKQVILDLDDAGQLATGKDKNIELGRLRTAVNQNAPGPWGVMQLRGAGPLIVKVDHIGFERKDGTKGVRAEVVRYTKIA